MTKFNKLAGICLILAALAVFAGSLVGAQVYRYRRVSALMQRQQTKWVIFAFAMVVLTVLGMFLVTQVLSPSGVLGVPPSLILMPIASAVLLSIPLSIGIAILRYRLWDIDLVINRTLVYAALTACVVGTYVLVVGYLGVLLRTEGNLFISLVAAGVVAVVFAPLRSRLQRAVNRLMYGERDDPYAVLSSLGERLEATLAPKAVLPTVVETVVQALRVPHAEISLQREDGFESAAEYGTPAGDPLVLPLTYQNETVGGLTVSPRVKNEPFAPADRRLLEDLAREEERLRLRRDFHDGIGPQLAALTLKIETARNRLGSDPTARDLLSDLAERARATVADVRRSVHALRETAAQYSQNGLRILVKAPEDLPPLPAAVEVAAYRIVQEALTNVMRHAGARECTVRFHLEEKADLLRLDVEDDGRGMGGDGGSGVGLSSMRERAEELGGACVFEPVATGGPCVRAELPVPNVSRDGEDLMPETSKIRVLIADDHPLFRDGMHGLLDSVEEPEVVGEAADGDEAVRKAAESRPDVVLVLTMLEDDDSVFAAMRAGAAGYLLKGAHQDEVLRAIRAVANGEAIFGSGIARRVMRFFSAEKSERQPTFPELTEREREILAFIARGRTNADISGELILSLKTVQNHVSNIFRKLQVSDRARAAIRAREAEFGVEGP